LPARSGEVGKGIGKEEAMPKIQSTNEVKLYDYCVGIDPGANGAIFTQKLLNGRVFETDVMKLTDRTTLDIVETIQELPNAESNRNVPGDIEIHTTHILLEKISPSGYGWSKSSMAKLYGSYKEIRAVVIALGYPIEERTPNQWQRGLKLRTRKKSETTTSWKNYLKSEAKQRYRFGASIITLGTCDAFLISEYLRQQVTNTRGLSDHA